MAARSNVGHMQRSFNGVERSAAEIEQGLSSVSCIDAASYSVKTHYILPLTSSKHIVFEQLHTCIYVLYCKKQFSVLCRKTQFLEPGEL